MHEDLLLKALGGAGALTVFVWYTLTVVRMVMADYKAKDEAFLGSLRESRETYVRLLTHQDRLSREVARLARKIDDMDRTSILPRPPPAPPDDDDDDDDHG